MFIKYKRGHLSKPDGAGIPFSFLNNDQETTKAELEIRSKDFLYDIYT